MFDSDAGFGASSAGLGMFKPSQKIALVIGCSDYAELRKEEGKEAFSDLPAAMADMKIIRTGLEHCNFTNDEIQMHENPNKDKVKNIFNTLIQRSW